MPTNSSHANLVQLFVGQLHYSATREDIKDIFNYYGTVQNVDILPSRQSNRGSATAIVSFLTTPEADAAIISLHGRYNMGRQKPFQVTYWSKSTKWSKFGYDHAVLLHQINESNPMPPPWAWNGGDYMQ